MIAAAQKNGPARTAILPSHGSTNLLKGKIRMNAHSHIPLTPTMTSHDADKLYDAAAVLVHQLHFLLNNLEWSFKLDRGRVDGTSVTLMFQASGIDATLWLAGEAWSSAASLRDAMVAIQDRFDAAEGGAS